MLAPVGYRAGQQIAAALVELIEPAAAAVSTFQVDDGDTAHARHDRWQDRRHERWRVEAYYAAVPEPIALTNQLARLLAIEIPQVSVESVPLQNWVTVSQAALPPVRIGRFTIHGSHDRARVSRGPNTILIDAGEAFGTAHHATTSGCVAALERLSRRTSRIRSVLDLGCGSGVLAIAAVRALPRARVVASDVDAVAIAVAGGNVRRNGARSIRLMLADGVPTTHPAGPRHYDLIFANILASALVALAPAIARAVSARGVVVLSGVLDRQAREVLGAYLPRGFALLKRERMAGWSTLTLRRSRAGRARPPGTPHRAQLRVSRLPSTPVRHKNGACFSTSIPKPTLA